VLTSPKRILWPTDFSPLSLYGGRHARWLCELFGSELHVVHVIAPPVAPDFSVALPAEIPIVYANDEVRQACRARLAELVQEHFAGLSNVVCEALFGSPWATVCGYAEQAGIDLIVVATHGRTGLRHVLIGSTAERIVQHAPCPVLVVKNPQKDFADPRRTAPAADREP